MKTDNLQLPDGGANPTPALQFDSEWRKKTRVRPGTIGEVKKFLLAHYLRKRPAIPLLVLVATHADRGELGCVVYSAPPRQADKRYGGVTWELARVYLLDEVPRNAETWLIAQSIRHIKKCFPYVKFLLSYADPSAGHSGTIYRAGGWKPDGKTDGERKTPRMDLVDRRTGKKFGRWGNVPPGTEVERVPRVSKHRYFFPLT